LKNKLNFNILLIYYLHITAYYYILLHITNKIELNIRKSIKKKKKKKKKKEIFNFPKIVFLSLHKIPKLNNKCFNYFLFNLFFRLIQFNILN